MNEREELANRRILVRSAGAVGHVLGKIGRSWDRVRVRLLGRTSHWAALPAVSSADVAGALETLEQVGRVHLPSYLQAIEPGRLLKERLGPTGACLTLDDLDAEPLTSEGEHVQVHVAAGCRPCGEALRAFGLVKARGLDPTASLSDVTAEFPPQIAMDDTLEFDLKFRAPQGVSILPDSVVMDGLFRNVKCKPMRVLDLNADGQSLLLAKCVGYAHGDLIKAGDVSGEVVDWVTVTGQTTTGRRFSSRGLVRLTERTKVQR
jgi:hypothetical protein